MEKLLNKIDFTTAQSNEEFYDALRDIENNGGMKAAEITKCLLILQKKVCVRNFPCELDDGFYPAMHIFKALYEYME
jgi:hypothetical protein